MRIIEDSQTLRQLRSEHGKGNRRVALVPTMGFLHQGHLSLVREARRYADSVLVSIFLNPTQFDRPSDFEKYPRNLKNDFELLRSEDVDAVFCPEVQDIYAPDAETWVSVDRLSQLHEGEFRPGHFRGVTTVVNILFNIVQPNTALFGEKDFQQLALIKKMVSDLHLDIQVIGCPTVREPSGLALSSRNARLTATGRACAPLLSRGLMLAQSLFLQGESSALKLLSVVESALSESDAICPEYIRLVNPETFEEHSIALPGDRIILAAWIDGVRLIDNVALGER